MSIDIEFFMMVLSYLMIAVGVVSFMVSVIVEVIKELPWLVKIPTSIVTLAASLILCPVVMVVACQYLKIIITWYYVFASFIAAFVVYLVSTGGWERVSEIWRRVKYRNLENRGSK